MDSREDPNTITLDLSSWDQPNAASEIYISDFDSMITTISPTPIPTITIDNSNGFNWSADTISLGDPVPKGTLTLKGEDADININGESLMTMIRGIQDRLNILAPDPAMEQEWSELAALREQYESKLAECRAKSKMWKTLQSMPPPEIE